MDLRDKWINAPERYKVLALLIFWVIFLWAQRGCAQCTTTTEFLSEFGSIECPCDCDFNSDGIVSATDLSLFLAAYPFPPSGELDIVPRWNNFYNDAGAGFDGFALFPTIQNSELTWSDIKDECEILWLIGDQVFWEGDDMIFNQANTAVMCSGAFPCTVRITYQGKVYERTEPSWLQIFFTPVPACDYGLTLFDANAASLDLCCGTAEPFEFCQNCNE